MKTSRMIALLPIGFLLLGSVSSAADRKGAQVVITAKSGSETRGELLAVKKDFLVVSSPSSGEVNDLSLPIADIHEVKIVKRTQAGKGALIGTLAGAAFGVVLAAMQNEDSFHFSTGFWAVTSGLSGTVYGAIIGAGVGKDRTLVFDKMPESVRQANLVSLSRYARIQGLH